MNFKNKHRGHQMKLHAIRDRSNKSLHMVASFNMRILLSQDGAKVVFSSAFRISYIKTSSRSNWTKAAHSIYRSKAKRREISRQLVKTVVISYQLSAPPAPHLRAKVIVVQFTHHSQYAWMQDMHVWLKKLRKIISTTRANFTRTWEVSNA